MKLSAEALGYISVLRTSYDAGHWRVLPESPLGHIVIREHDPYAAVLPVGGLILVFACVHRMVRRLGIVLGRALATPAAAAAIDWRRFGDTAYFTCLHLALTAYFVIFLRHEAESWLADTGLWWEFVQPPLSPALRWYFIIQLALTSESCLYMAYGLAATKSSLDVPMLLHHASTMCAARPPGLRTQRPAQWLSSAS